MKNQDVREAVAMAGLRLWQLADAMGITDAALSRKLRKEWSNAEKEIAFSIVARLEKEAG